MIVLSNCNHVSQFVIPNLVEQFKKQGYPCMLEMERVSGDQFDAPSSNAHVCHVCPVHPMLTCVQ